MAHYKSYSSVSQAKSHQATTAPLTSH
ncbi:hypothetical protein CCACVL1_09636 [Corchorus capsularis]|uniref:Uncharacterized protein n=1 Tax=Corchorus capsularis TaxID=210143 RepID=A0A1R3IUU8_COCAP|nr:hypothetical protein CCACVL1_09636 [Corchorus capsularis]